MNSRPGVTAITDMAVLLSEPEALPSGLRLGESIGHYGPEARFIRLRQSDF